MSDFWFYAIIGYVITFLILLFFKPKTGMISHTLLCAIAATIWPLALSLVALYITVRVGKTQERQEQ